MAMKRILTTSQREQLLSVDHCLLQNKSAD